MTGLKMNLDLTCLVVLALTLAVNGSGALRAQPAPTLLYQVAGGGSGHDFGHAVAAVGDLDEDGVVDFIVGAPGAVGQPGYVQVLSGMSGALLFTMNGLSVNDFFGASVAGAGDVDGDGVPDVIVGAWADDPGGMSGAGRATVFSGATGGVLLTFDGLAPSDYFGDSVAGAGDIDGDGHSDLIVGAWAADAGAQQLTGRATLFSGSNGTVLRTFSGYQGWMMGDAVANAGDFNGDGVADQLISAIGGNPASTPDDEAYGYVFVMSGLDGSTLWTGAGHGVWDTLGYAVATVGDIDGDQVPDVAATLSMGLPTEAPPRIAVLSGTTGAVRLAVRDFGTSLAAAGDIDGDGLADLAVGDWDSGEVRVLSGGTGVALFRIAGLEADWEGPSVAMVGDKLVVGESHADPGGLTDAGQVRVYALVAEGGGGGTIDCLTQSENGVTGTATGSHVDTHADDSAVEVIEEVESGGKPANRTSLLEHVWTLDVAAGSAVTLHVQAWHSANSEADDFILEFSLDGQAWWPLLTLTKNADDGLYETATLPPTSGQTTWIRATDTDRTPGNRTLDQLFVDHLFIRSEGSAVTPAPPSAPTSLVATPASSASISLRWSDSAIDEEGFRIERSPDGSAWFPLAIVVGRNACEFVDTMLSPSTAWTYRVQAFNAGGDSAWSTSAVATTFPGGTMESPAIGEVAAAGTVSGERLHTWSNDPFAQVLEEWNDGGNPKKSRSFLEHTWIFSVPAGSAATLELQAWHTPNSEGDDFVFEYSPDGQDYLPLMIVTKTIDDGLYQSASLPSTGGILFIRITDADRTAGKVHRDSLFIDHMFIRTLP